VRVQKGDGVSALCGAIGCSSFVVVDSPIGRGGVLVAVPGTVLVVVLLLVVVVVVGGGGDCTQH
jgi:hypothetical protein